MLTYSRAMKMYNETPEEKSIRRIKTIDEYVKYDCEYSLMGRILYSIRIGETKAELMYGSPRFQDKGYCSCYAKKIKKYLQKYGYENVDVSFPTYDNDSRYPWICVKVYF